MSPKNFASTTKERERKIGIAGNFKSGGPLVGGQKKLDKNNDGQITGQDFKLLRSSKGMRRGGKVIKMRGGGAATRGMNFNRGY